LYSELIQFNFNLKSLKNSLRNNFLIILLIFIQNSLLSGKKLQKYLNLRFYLIVLFIVINQSDKIETGLESLFNRFIQNKLKKNLIQNGCLNSECKNTGKLIDCLVKNIFII